MVGDCATLRTCIETTPVELQDVQGQVPFANTFISPSVINSLSLSSFTFPSPNCTPSPISSPKSEWSCLSFSIPFISLNCNKANYIGHAVLNSLVDKTAVLLFQEPWVGRIGVSRSDDTAGGLEVFGMCHQKNWQQFIPIPHYAGLNHLV